MLELSFEQPEHGWVPVCLKANSAVIDFIASDVPNNPVQELVDALSIVNNGREVEVWWHLEPDGYYFRFVPQGNDVTLSILFSKGSFEGDKQEVAVLHGRKAEVLLPIWRALRRFETLDVMEPHWPPLNSQGLKELGSKLRA